VRKVRGIRGGECTGRGGGVDWMYLGGIAGGVERVG
jgi:hypothetical protein